MDNEKLEGAASKVIAQMEVLIAKGVLSVDERETLDQLGRTLVHLADSIATVLMALADVSRK